MENSLTSWTQIKNLIDSRLHLAPGVNNVSSNVRAKDLNGFTFTRFDKLMDFQIKLFSWPDRGNHLIMITRGVLDINGNRPNIPGGGDGNRAPPRL